MSLTDFPPPIRIPIVGANRQDVEKEQAQAELARDLLASAVHDSATLYLKVITKIITNHNENVPVTKTFNLKFFERGLRYLCEDFLAGLNDLNSDLSHELEYAIEEEE